MAEPENPQAFWIKTIVDWIASNSGVTGDRLELGRKFTEEPYKLGVVKVLNLMDELTRVYKETYGANLTLAQNWRLTYRTATVGDFIAAFLEVVTSETLGRPKKSGIS